MRLISHRGNLLGSNSCVENHPDSIQNALQNGFDCEIDVWKIENNYLLGHDKPEYLIDFDFLNNSKLWLHCKNHEALFELHDLNLKSNVFFHDQDDYTLTSKNIIWTFPNKIVGKRCVIVADWKPTLIKENIYGICSDYVSQYKELM